MIHPVTASYTQLVRLLGVSVILLSGKAGTVAAQIDTRALESHVRGRHAGRHERAAPPP